MRRGQPSTPTHWLFLVTRPPAVALSSFLSPYAKVAIALLQGRSTHFLTTELGSTTQQLPCPFPLLSWYPSRASSFSSAYFVPEYPPNSTSGSGFIGQADTDRYLHISSYFSISSIPSCLQVYTKGTSLPGLLCFPTVVRSAISKYVVFLCKNIKLVYMNISFFFFFFFPHRRKLLN